jgi:hypothetical protein
MDGAGQRHADAVDDLPHDRGAHRGVELPRRRPGDELAECRLESHAADRT